MHTCLHAYAWRGCINVFLYACYIHVLELAAENVTTSMFPIWECWYVCNHRRIKCKHL